MKSLKYYLTILLLLSLAATSHAQLASSDKKIIKNELLKQINSLRKDKGVQSLALSDRLEKPAELHSFYMAENNVLAHTESIPKYRDPSKRVAHFSPQTFDRVGENVLESRRVKFPLSKGAALRIANEMFNSWKDSPGHYANMIQSEFDMTNFGFSVDKRNKIYATNVFARKGTNIPEQLSDNQFGLLEDVSKTCNDATNFHSNVLINIGNTITIRGNDVMLYYHNKDYFTSIFTGERDGIAVDLLELNQFACNTPNRLDMSPIHDGVLLKPIYIDEILRNNEAESDFRIISKIGTLPSHLQGKPLTFVVLFLKDGVVCKKVIPSEVPHSTYALRPLEYKLDNPLGVKMSEKLMLSSITFPFDFNTNQSSPLRFPKININSEEIELVQIKSYSSVEGSSETNDRLHKIRAEKIREYLKKKLNVNNDKFQIETKENWDEFYFQLKFYFADSLISQSKDYLKKVAAKKDIAGIPWDSILFQQRKSYATVYYRSKGNNDVKPTKNGISNLKKALITNDTLLAQKALFFLYENMEEDSDELLKPPFVDYLQSEKALVANAAAALTKTYRADQTKTIKFVNRWINSIDELSPQARFNLLSLYTLVNNDLLKVWDLPSRRLANVISPVYIKKSAREFSSTDLMLNLHLTFTKYFGQVNDSKNLNKSFNYISNYFSRSILSEKDMIALSKFYNHWSMFEMTNRYLLKKFKSDELEEEGIFLLIETLTHFHDSENFDVYEKIYQKAIELNEKRWCEFVSRNIQFTRDLKIKEFYCQTCK
ncbi:MAG: CAP domain-containing protein [Saprospiraceae bacterium]